MTQIIDGRKIKKDILEEVKKGIAELPFQPVFCDVLVGDDPVSAQYVRMKAKTAEAVGFKFHKAHFPKTISTEDLIPKIEKLNKIPRICGLIIQLPLPEHLDRQKILNAVSPKIDVDCLGEKASNLFYANKNFLGFPTALACVYILDSLNLEIISPAGQKKILIIGQGILVGRPVAQILKSRGWEVDIIVRQTEDEIKKNLIKNADIIISATGQGKLIKGEMIKKGAIIIDAGTSESKGGIVGDVDLDSIQDVASFVSPVPGGVGPVTVAMLLKNVLEVAQKLGSRF